MADFKEFGEKVEDFAKSFADKTGEVVEVQKLKSKIRSNQRKVSKGYIDIGKIVHEKHKSGIVIDTCFTNICDELDDLEGEIQDLKEQVNSVRGYATCRKCGAAVDTQAVFCSKCGAQMF